MHINCGRTIEGLVGANQQELPCWYSNLAMSFKFDLSIEDYSVNMAICCIFSNDVTKSGFVRHMSFGMFPLIQSLKS